MNQLELVGESIWTTYRSMAYVLLEAGVWRWTDKAGRKQILKINPRTGPEKTWETWREAPDITPGAELTRRHRSMQAWAPSQPGQGREHRRLDPLGPPEIIAHQQKQGGASGDVTLRDPETREIIKRVRDFPRPADKPGPQHSVKDPQAQSQSRA